MVSFSLIQYVFLNCKYKYIPILAQSRAQLSKKEHQVVQAKGFSHQGPVIKHSEVSHVWFTVLLFSFSPNMVCVNNSRIFGRKHRVV